MLSNDILGGVMEKVYKFIQSLDLEEAKKFELVSLIEQEISNIQRPLLLNVEQASAFLGVGEATIRNLGRKKDFPKMFNGNKLLVRRSKVEEWLDKHEGENIGK